jgi:hypothetical protein
VLRAVFILDRTLYKYFVILFSPEKEIALARAQVILDIDYRRSKILKRNSKHQKKTKSFRKAKMKVLDESNETLKDTVLSLRAAQNDAPARERETVSRDQLERFLSIMASGCPGGPSGTDSAGRPGGTGEAG